MKLINNKAEQKNFKNTCLLRPSGLFESIDILPKQYLPWRRDELQDVQEFCVTLVLPEPEDLELQEPHAHRVAHVEQLLLELVHPICMCVAVLHDLGEEVQVGTLAHFALDLGDGPVEDVLCLGWWPCAAAAGQDSGVGQTGCSLWAACGSSANSTSSSASRVTAWVAIRSQVCACSVRWCLTFKNNINECDFPKDDYTKYFLIKGFLLAI